MEIDDWGNDRLDKSDGSVERENPHASSNSEILIASDVKFNNGPLEKIIKLKGKRKRHISESEKQLIEEYDRELNEQRYKRLMHLLNKSKFYSSYLVDKISKSIDKEKNTKRKTRANIANVTNDENTPPIKKKKMINSRNNYKMQEYISSDVKKQIQNKKKKLNLSMEEIEAELSEDSDNETKKSTDVTDIVPKYFHGELRDYQHEGLQWLKVLYENGLNGILADEMGLGKTIQVIALFCHLIEKQQAGPYLIIAPLSTIPNWLIEFERFAPDIPVKILYGSRDKRAAQCLEIKHRYFVTGNYKTQPVVITSYEMPLYDVKFFQSQQWRYIVVDEGQRIKNPNCLLVKNLKTLNSMNRLILTGTPLQNNLAELWSLLNFLLPDIFDDLAMFESWFNVKEVQNMGTENFLKREKEKCIMSALREILKPFMLRRIKADVCLDIPPKKELIVYTPLTELQHDLYKAVLNRDIQMLSKIEEPTLIIPTINGKKPKRRCVLRNKYGYREKSDSENSLEHETSSNISLEDSSNSKDTDQWKALKSIDKKNLLMWKQYTDITQRNQDFFIHIQLHAPLTMYKKIVNHPYLVHYPLDSIGMPKIDEDLIKSSGKLLVLDAMLAKLKAQGHKVLLFSTMTMILDMIEDYLMLRDHNYVRLDGGTAIEKRKENIANFNNNQDIFLFLISTRAGGIGLNLAGADTVIIYDSDWNPQADIQAMARCHRIGQTKPVVVYRLITKATIDEAIIKRSEIKRVLEKMVISKELLSERALGKDTLLRMKQLLESKEYKVVTSEKEVFTEAELNKLLDRSDMINIPDIDNSRE